MNERTAPVRDGLCRSVPFEVIRSEESESDGLSIAGYAAMFNQSTRIDSWEGCFDEEIAPGAFKRTLRDRTPKMQFDHGHHPLLGSLPIGKWNSAREDGQGLYVEGRLTENWLTVPFRDAIRDGAVEGMSFRFSVVQEQWFDRDGEKVTDARDLMDMLSGGEDHERGPLKRVLREVKCTEAGPVTWPAYEGTSVGVRSGVVMIDLGRLDEPRMQRRLAEAVLLADQVAASGPDDDDDLDDAARQMIGAGFEPTAAITSIPATSTTMTTTNGLISVSTTSTNGDSLTIGGSAGLHSDSDSQRTETQTGQHSSATSPPTDLKSRIRARIAEAGKIIQKIDSGG